MQAAELQVFCIILLLYFCTHEKKKKKKKKSGVAKLFIIPLSATCNVTRFLFLFLFFLKRLK